MYVYGNRKCIEYILEESMVAILKLPSAVGTRITCTTNDCMSRPAS